MAPFRPKYLSLIINHLREFAPFFVRVFCFSQFRHFLPVSINLKGTQSARWKPPKPPAVPAWKPFFNPSFTAPSTENYNIQSGIPVFGRKARKVIAQAEGLGKTPPKNHPRPVRPAHPASLLFSIHPHPVPPIQGGGDVYDVCSQAFSPGCHSMGFQPPVPQFASLREIRG